MANFISEDQIEQALLQRLQHLHGCGVASGQEFGTAIWLCLLRKHRGHRPAVFPEDAFTKMT